MMRWPSCSEMPLAMTKIEMVLSVGLVAAVPATEWADQTGCIGGARRMPGSTSTGSKDGSDGVVSWPLRRWSGRRCGMLTSSTAVPAMKAVVVAVVVLLELLIQYLPDGHHLPNFEDGGIRIRSQD